MTVQVNVQAPVYYAAAGRIEPLTATDGLVMPAGWLGVGTAPFTGATARASVGAGRFAALGNGIVFRNVTDAGDIGGLSLQAANRLVVGGPYPVIPTSLWVDGGTVYLGSVPGLTVSGSIVSSNVASFQWSGPTVNFAATAITPVITQLAPAVDVAAYNMTLRAQAGGAASAAAGRTGGILYLDGGPGGPGTAALAAGAGGANYHRGGGAGANAGGGGADGGVAGVVGGLATGAGRGGDVLVQGGDHAVGGTHGSVAIGALPANWQSAETILFIGQMVAAPTAAPAAGAFMWYDGTNLKVRTPTSGEVVLA